MEGAGGAEAHRATEADAWRLATEQYMAGERVDMRQLAGRLGVSRTTLYRWLGGREQVLDRIVGELAAMTAEHASATARGSGRERVLDGSRIFVEVSARFEPARRLVTNEPAVAMRVLMSPESSASRAMAGVVFREIQRELPEWDAVWARDVAEAMTQVGLAFAWTQFVSDSGADAERALKAMSMLLREPPEGWSA